MKERRDNFSLFFCSGRRAAANLTDFSTHGRPGNVWNVSQFLLILPLLLLLLLSVSFSPPFLFHFLPLPVLDAAIIPALNWHPVVNIEPIKCYSGGRVGGGWRGRWRFLKRALRLPCCQLLPLDEHLTVNIKLIPFIFVDFCRVDSFDPIFIIQVAAGRWPVDGLKLAPGVAMLPVCLLMNI